MILVTLTPSYLCFTHSPPFPSVSLSLSLTHAPTVTHSHKLSLTNTLTLSHSPFLSLSLTHSLSHKHTHSLSLSGTVVILRNRFEDVKMGHKILTSPIDGIKSHFKTSYGLTVKLLETKTLEECRALIERGFGAYLLQKKVQKK